MNDNKKIAVNSIIIFIRLIVVSLIGIIASRIVLDALGASDYGLYNVVGGIVTLLNVINSSMTSTTYRYIAFELGKGAEGNPNKVFNASFIIHGCFALLIIVLGLTVGEWYVNNYLNIDPGKFEDAKFIYHLSIITAALNTLSIPYKGLLVAYEKFSVSAVVDIFGRLVYCALVLFVLHLAQNRLRLYGIIHLLVIFLECSIYWLYCIRKNYNIVKFCLVKDKDTYKGMLSFSVWTLYGAVATVGKAQGSVLIINYFFGTLVNAAYAVANQVDSFIKAFALCLNNAAVPQITKNFSGGNQQRSIKLASYISKYTFIMMCIVAYPVIMDMDFLLDLWLKEVPEGATSFCQWMVLIALIGCMGEGIPPLIQASGKLKTFQLVICTLYLVGLPIAIMCYKLGAPAVAVLVVYAIISFVIAFVRLYLVKKVLHFDIAIFFKTSYNRMFLIAVPLTISFFFYHPENYTFTQHLLGLVCLEIFLLISIIIFGIDKQEWNMLKPLINKYLHKICKR